MPDLQGSHVANSHLGAQITAWFRQDEGGKGLAQLILGNIHINLIQSSSFPEAVHSFNFLHPTTRMTYHKNENKIGVSVLEAMLVKSFSCP